MNYDLGVKRQTAVVAFITILFQRLSKLGIRIFQLRSEPESAWNANHAAAVYSLPFEAVQMCQSRHCIPRDLKEDV
jgi:hypothetical protein